MAEINQNPFVYTTLGSDKESGRYLDIVGKAEQVEEQRIIDWWRQERNESVGVSELIVLRILVQQVKLMDKGNQKKRTKA